jgi:hypothetical protein
VGFFNLDDVVKAHKVGLLSALLADCTANDLALLKHELSNYAEKQDKLGDYKRLIEELEFLLDERLAAEQK